MLYVAELGTVSGAATALGHHRATVNRHIDALEAELGAKVFLRHAQGYSLTEIGEEVLRVAQTTQGLMDGLTGRVRAKSAEVDGEIKLTLLAPFVGLILAPIDAFKTRHPNCLVSIDTTEDLVRLEHGDAQVAIRAGAKPDHPDYVTQSLGQVSLRLYAHDTYRARFGVPKRGDNMTGHRYVAPHAADRR